MKPEKRHYADVFLIELLQYRFVTALADAVGLWWFHFGFGVVDIVDRQEELEVVFIDAPAIFSAAICQDAQRRQIVLFIER